MGMAADRVGQGHSLCGKREIEMLYVAIDGSGVPAVARET
jgi:hypothetical protein